MTLTPVRSVIAYVLVAVAALLAPVAVLGAWTQRNLVSTDGYVSAVAPLAADPAVQRSIETAVSDAIVQAVPVGDLVGSLPKAFSGAGDLAEAAERHLVEASVASVVQSDAFPALWVAANRSAQTQVLAQLEEPSTNVGDGTRIVFDLDPVAEAVRQRLITRGIPLQNVRFDFSGQQAVVLLPSSDVRHAARLWTIFDSTSRSAGPVAMVLAISALVIAPHRRRVLLVEALALLGAVGLAALLAANGHHWYVDRVQTGTGAPVAAAIGGVLDDSLAHWLRSFALAAGALVVAALALLALPLGRSPSRPPRQTAEAS